MKCVDCNYHYKNPDDGDDYACCHYPINDPFPAPCEFDEVEDYETEIEDYDEYEEEPSQMKFMSKNKQMPKDMKTLTLHVWGCPHKVTFKTDRYVNNNNLYIGITCWDDGWPEPWSNLTVNLNKKLPSNVAYIDCNNNNGDEIISWLVKNGLGECTGGIAYSNWCAYPEFKFNMDKIAEYCSRY